MVTLGYRCGRCGSWTVVAAVETLSKEKKEGREGEKKISESFFFYFLPLPYISKTC